ncbi:MAG TPA: SPASM domain-containing protein, partial [Nitrososphaera sp.]|nr:SPASM domain-containing protein [Nitrososphaera sp.]
EHSDEIYHCGGGLNSFAIDPQGRMSICVLSHFDSYDLRQGSFSEGWNDFLNKTRRKKMTMMTKCVKCEIKAMCGMCPANGELESGHAEKPVDYLCQVAHLRAHSFEINIPPHGDCEYCEGGQGYDYMVESAASLRKHIEGQMASKTFSRYLPVVNAEKTTQSSCSSCSCH